MSDFKVRVNLEFTPDPRARQQIQRAVTQAAAGAQITLQKATISRAAANDLQREIERVTNVRSRGLNRIAQQVRELQASVGRSLRQAAIGIVPERALENLTVAQQRATREAFNLQRAFRTLGSSAGTNVTQAVTSLTQLREVFSALGIVSGRAALTQDLFAAALARTSKAAVVTATTTASVAESTQSLAALQRGFGATQTAVTSSVRNTAIALGAVKERNEEILRSGRNVTRANKDQAASFISTGNAAETFGANIGKITTRFAAYLVSIRAILAVQNAFRDSLASIVEFDAVIQDLQKVVNETPQGLSALSASLFDVAQITGRAVTDVADSFGTFVRQGLNTEEALKRTQAALTATAISTLSTDEATKLITSSLQIFGDQLTDANQLLDLISVTGDKAATTQTAIAQALTRSAGAAETAGISFRELIALIAATIERSQEAAGKVGTAFKTILTRIQSNREAFIANANALGANIRANDDLFTILQKLSVVFQELDTVQKTQLATTISGQRQVNIFVALVESFNRALDLQAQATDSVGAAQAKLAIEQQKISTRAQILINNFKELVVVLSNAEEGAGAIGGLRNSLAGIIDFVSGAAAGLTDLVKGLKEAGGIGFTILSTFSSITKLAFFAGGAALIRAVLSGLLGVRSVVRQTVTEFSNLTRAIQSATGQLVQQGSEEGKILTIEEKRVGALRRILDLTKQIVGAESRAGRRARERGERARFGTGTVGGAAAASAGLVVGVGIATDALQEFAGNTKAISEELNDSAGIQKAALAEISASAINLGATFGILAGSVRTGVFGALSIAGFQVLKFARDQERNAKILLEATEAEASVRLDFEQVIKTGNRDLEIAFRSLADRSDQTAQGFEASFAVLDSIAKSTLKRDIDSALKSVADVLEEGRKTIDNIFVRLRREQARARAVEPIRTRIAAADIAIAGGELIDPFSAIDDIVAGINVKLEQNVGAIGDGASAASALLRITQAISRANEQQGQEVAKVLQSLQLETPTITKSRKEAEALREVLQGEETELDKLISRLNEIEGQRKRIIGEAIKERDEQERIQQEAQSTIDRIAEGIRTTPTVALVEGIRESNEQLVKQEARQKALIALAKEEASVKDQIKDIDTSRQGILGQITAIEAQQEKIAKERLDTFNDIISDSDVLIEKGIELAKISELNTRIIRDRLPALADQLQFEFDIARQQLRGQSAQERLTDIRVRAERRITSELREANIQRERVIQRLRDQAEAARAAGDEERAARLEVSAAAARRAFEEELPQIEAQIRAQVDIDLDRRLFDQLQANEKALTDSRIREIERVRDAEQQSVERRVELLQQLGDAAIGREVFERTLRNIPNQAARTFGRLGAAVISIQRQSVNDFTQSIVQEFAALTNTTIPDLEQALSLEDTEARFKALREAGVLTSESLANAEEARNEIIARSQEQLDNERQRLLDRVKTASDRLNESEQNLLQVRNQLPQINERIIETRRALAQANENVDSSTVDLIAAFQDVADAQAELNFQTRFAVFQARQGTGAFQSIGEQFSELSSIFSSVTSEIRVSEESRLQLARQIAQEQLSLLQRQFSNVQSLGARAATATADQLFELQNAIGAAAAISTGTVGPGQFSADILQAVAGLGDVFPNLQRTLAEFGLERLGIDPTTLENIEQEILELARVTAATNREQVIAANEQVRLAQQQLAQAEQDRSLAQDQLAVARDQKEAVLMQIAVARGGVGIARARLSAAASESAQALGRLDGIKFVTAQVRDAVLGLNQVIAAQRTDIEAANRDIEQELGLRDFKQEIVTTNDKLMGFQTEIARVATESNLVANAKREETITVNGFTVSARDARTAVVEMAVAVQSLARRFSEFRFPVLTGGGTGTPNFAGGSLSNQEIASVLEAAQKEKRAMPPSSRLMVANTSETVLTRRQARVMGLRPLIRSNAQEGNAAAETGSLTQAVDTLNTAINNLNNQLNNPSLIQQEINVNVDTERTINVRGVDAVDRAVRDILEDRFGVMASTEEVSAIAQSLAALIQTLREQGVTISA